VKKALDRIRAYFNSGEAGNVVGPTGPVSTGSLVAFGGTTGKTLEGLNDPKIKIEGVVTIPEIYPSEHRYLVVNISGVRIYALLGVLVPYINSWFGNFPDQHLKQVPLSYAIVAGSFFHVPCDIPVDGWLPTYEDVHFPENVLNPAIVAGSYFEYVHWPITVDRWLPQFPDIHLREPALSMAIRSGSYFDFAPWPITVDRWLPTLPDLHLKKGLDPAILPEPFSYVGEPIP
jgi:hypothetical protein